MDYTKLFSVPMWAAIACLVLLEIFYPRTRPAANVAARAS
jgi:hypothetical protein